MAWTPRRYALATQIKPIFQHVRTSLIESGEFTALRGSMRWRLYKNGLPVDIMPFDGMEGVNRPIGLL